MRLPIVDGAEIAWVTVDEMRELDRLAVEAGLALPVMMENAGRSLAEVAAGFWDCERRVDVLVGVGGNGGGAAVAARHLSNRGWQVTVHMAPTGTPGDVTARQIALARHAEATVTTEPPDGSGLVVDGLLGYGLSGAPRREQAALIDAVGGRPTVALDVPSGLELQTGTLHDRAVQADVTLTLAAPKHALRPLKRRWAGYCSPTSGSLGRSTSRPASNLAGSHRRLRSSRSGGDGRHRRQAGRDAPARAAWVTQPICRQVPTRPAAGTPRRHRADGQAGAGCRGCGAAEPSEVLELLER